MPIRTLLVFILTPGLVAPVTASAGEPLVVYCGRSEALVGDLLAGYEKASGVDLDVRYGKTPALAAKLGLEAAESPADVFYAQESGYLGALGANGLLAELPADLLAEVETGLSDPSSRWVAVSGRARVLVYNPGALNGDDLPRSLAQLAEPRFRGRLGWAPGNASFQAHVSALRHAWGEEKTEAWLKGVLANEPRAYPKNSPQVKAAAAGEIDAGWVNHYYLHKVRTGADFAAANHSFTDPGDLGNVLIVSGAGIRAGSPRAEAALGLLRYLVSAEAQEHLAATGYEYPARPGIATHPDVRPRSELNLADVDQAHLTDIGPTVAMLQRLGLL